MRTANIIDCMGQLAKNVDVWQSGLGQLKRLVQPRVNLPVDLSHTIFVQGGATRGKFSRVLASIHIIQNRPHHKTK